MMKQPMKQTKAQLGLLAVSVFAVTILAAGPVYAERGNGRDDTVKTTATTDDTSTSSMDDASTQSAGTGTSNAGSTNDVATSTETEVEHGVVTTKPDELRGRAERLIEAKRTALSETKKTKLSADGRQKACKAREANLTKKITNFDKQAKRHLERYDTAYAKLQAYQKEQDITAENYTALVATADAKRATATAAVDALKTAGVKIDCSSQDPAAAVATVKASVANAKTALKDYRTAVKNVLVALMTAKSDNTKVDATDDNTTNSTADGGTN
jgi:chromosome segregation ATPase